MSKKWVDFPIEVMEILNSNGLHSVEWNNYGEWWVDGVKII
jgi:hypothetical protein